MQYSAISRFWRQIILVIFGVIIARMIIVSLSSVTFNPEVDEGQYFYYALKEMLGGLPAFKDILQGYIADNSVWGLPVPMRFGFIITAGFFCGIFGVSFFSLALLSSLSFFAAVFFAYRLSRRIFGLDIAFLAGMLFLSSPLSLGLSRRALSDSTANLFLLCAFLFQIYYYTSGFQRWKKWALAAMVFLAIAFKETNILFIIPLAVSSLALLPEKGLPKVAGEWTVIYILPVALIFVIYKLLFANLADVFTVLFFLPAVNSQNYVALYQSGPWFRYLIDFLLISPWVMILGLYYIIYIFMHNLKKEKLALALFVVVTVFVYSFFIKNLRYLGVLDFPLRVLAVMALFSVSRFRRKQTFIFVLVAVAFICVTDLMNFHNFFIQKKLYDLVTPALLSCRNILPF